MKSTAVHRLSLSFALLVAAAGCKEEPAPTAVAAANAPAPAPSAERKPLAPLGTAIRPWPVPVGIPLGIEPGQGVGPIRFGARLDTIERLMDRTCDEKAPPEGKPASALEQGDVLCRYSGPAVEFELEKDELVRIHVHGKHRPFSADGVRRFGIFNGRFTKGPTLGMFRSAVEEVLGKPERVVPKDEVNRYQTVEVCEYPNMQLEYDRLANGNVVLGGVILTKP